MNECEKILQILKKNGLAFENIPEKIKEEATDIRVSSKGKLTLFTYKNKYSINIALSENKLEELIMRLCDYSLFKHSQEIKKGFIIIEEKYRCGICGTGINKSGEICGYKNITSINIRIPRIIKGASDSIYNACKDKMLYGVLIVGEPSSGKTTLLKDLINKLEKEYKVSVLDEKYELYGNFECDVLLGVNRKDGIKQLIKNMSPQIIICDELDESDIETVEYSVSTGVSFIASAHGNFKSNVIRPAAYELLSTKAFKTIVELDSREKPGKIHRIYDIDELNENYRFHSDYSKRNFIRK